MKFAEQLKYYRKNRGLTQHQLAVKVGVSDGAMSNYEQGTRTPPNRSNLNIIFKYGEVFVVIK